MRPGTGFLFNTADRCGTSLTASTPAQVGLQVAAARVACGALELHPAGLQRRWAASTCVPGRGNALLCGGEATLSRSDELDPTYVERNGNGAFASHTVTQGGFDIPALSGDRGVLVRADPPGRGAERGGRSRSRAP